MTKVLNDADSVNPIPSRPTMPLALD
jgi:hypothetical protein